MYPDFSKEPSDLASGRPNVKNVTLLLDQWWGSGIVHAKVWISDHRNVYIGSANNDWKSLTQVHSLRQSLFLISSWITRGKTSYFRLNNFVRKKKNVDNFGDWGLEYLRICGLVEEFRIQNSYHAYLWTEIMLNMYHI